MFQLVILTFSNCYVILRVSCWTILPLQSCFDSLLPINVLPYYRFMSLAANNLVILISVGYYPEINHIYTKLVIS